MIKYRELQQKNCCEHLKTFTFWKVEIVMSTLALRKVDSSAVPSRICIAAKGVIFISADGRRKTVVSERSMQLQISACGSFSRVRVLSAKT